MTTPGDIEIQIFTRSLKERFLISPNELSRGDDVWSGLQMDERCMLSALLTMSNGYRTTRKRIDRIAAPQKSSVVDRILKNLKARRFLRQTRVNGAGGRFVWRWEVFMYPYDADQAADVSAGQTMPGNSGDGGSASDDADVSAGQTMGGFSMDGQTVDGESTDGSTVDGSAVDGESGDIRRTKDLEVPGVRGTSGEKNPPYPLAPSAAADSAPGAAAGGDSLSEDDRKTLNDAVAYAVEQRKGQRGWAVQQVAAAARAQLDNRRSADDIALALRAAATDATAAFPGRIGPMLDLTAAKAAAQREEQEGPAAARYLDPSTPRCRKHPENAAGACSACRSEAIEAKPAEPARRAAPAARPPAADLAATRAVIAAAREKVHGKDNRRRDALAELGKAAAEVTPRPVVDQVVDLAAAGVPAQREAADLVNAR